MSHQSEHDSDNDESSQSAMEYHSESGSTESEEGSTEAEDDVFLSIQYPPHPLFLTPYFHNQAFDTSDEALMYITKHFNFESIPKEQKSFSDLTQLHLLQHIYQYRSIHTSPMLY